MKIMCRSHTVFIKKKIKIQTKTQLIINLKNRSSKFFESNNNNSYKIRHGQIMAYY